jgi:hemerythrin-like domain-containing protein
MKREKFLWPLTQSHHRGLVLAKQVREALSQESSSSQVEALSRRVQELFNEELTQHFWDEEKLITLFEGNQGPGEPESVRLRREHRLLQRWGGEKSAESLRQFAELLTNHIRFEEDVFFPMVEKSLSEAVKKTAGEMLVHPEKPKVCHD